MKHRFMRKTNRLTMTILATSILAAALLATGCAGSRPGMGTSDVPLSTLDVVENKDPNKTTSLDVFAMDTYMTVTAYGSNGELATRKAVEEIKRLDALLSTGSGESQVSKLNESQTGILKEDSLYLYQRSMEIAEMTDGAFDIAIYPVMKAWGFTDQNYHVPEKEELVELLEITDPGKLNFDQKSNTLSFAEDGMAIDFGGIAKGYTSARIMDIYRENGVTSGLVSLGGNVQVLGSKPDGSSYKIAIQNPDASAGYLGVLSANDQAVITSGGYERFFEQDGKTYHHIIDPATAYPADSGLISVTIVSSDGTLADGLSTSLFIMGKEKAIELWKANSEKFDFILYDEEETLWVSGGIKDAFSSDKYHVEIVEK